MRPSQSTRTKGAAGDLRNHAPVITRPFLACVAQHTRQRVSSVPVTGNGCSTRLTPEHCAAAVPAIAHRASAQTAAAMRARKAEAGALLRRLFIALSSLDLDAALGQVDDRGVGEVGIA